MLKILNFSYLNSSEAIYGNMVLKDNKLIIPYFNLYIMENDNQMLKKSVGKYLKKGYLVFENVSGIVWDYELSRRMFTEKVECYGGTNYFNNLYNEFWVSFEKNYIYIEEDFDVSKFPWNLNLDENVDFFSIIYGNTEW